MVTGVIRKYTSLAVERSTRWGYGTIKCTTKVEGPTGENIALTVSIDVNSDVHVEAAESMQGVSRGWNESGMKWNIEVGHINKGSKHCVAVCMELEGIEEVPAGQEPQAAASWDPAEDEAGNAPPQ